MLTYHGLVDPPMLGVIYIMLYRVFVKLVVEHTRKRTKQPGLCETAQGRAMLARERERAMSLATQTF